ncbi:MAG: hypothetical protein NVSMB56_13130 [Pyrinomonadaceae bacterium]
MMSDQPTNASDDLLTPVLDKGFVRLVDFLGGDNAVVQGARVSFGQESKGDERDRKLIHYLMKHEHGTPFEMAVFKFHVKCPIFVARQWFRHRMGCLSGDTLLHFDLPSAVSSTKRQLHKTSIGKFHELWHRGSSHTTRKRKPLFLERVEAEKLYSVPELAKLVERRPEDLRNLIRKSVLQAQRSETSAPTQSQIFVLGSAWHEYAIRNYTARVPMRERLKKMQLRMCNEATGEIEYTHVADIWQSGVKQVYRVTLENGYQIRMTEDHRCLTEKGWLTLGQATKLRRAANDSVIWSIDAPALAVNGVAAYQDATWLAKQRSDGLNVAQIADRAGASTHTIRKYLARFNLQYTPHLFWRQNQKQPMPETKPRPTQTRLLRTFSRIARIEYVGEEMTYDLEVTGLYHNFVANGFIVHNSYNEISYRYVEVEDEFYVPLELRAQDTKNKQASFAGGFTDEKQTQGRALMDEAYRAAYAKYEELLALGVARELARIVLPVSIYTQFYVAYNARSLMNFVRLRSSAGAQFEIKQYAEAMNRIFKAKMPWTFEAFEQYVLKNEGASK